VTNLYKNKTVATPLQICLKEKEELITYQRAFSDFLGKYKFETFATFTTKKTLQLTGARRMAENFARHIDAGNSSTMFWAAEPFDSKIGYHFHGLINTYGRISNLEMRNYWSEYKDFGYSDFLKIHRKLGAKDQIENYCSKYITKRLADYDLYVGGSLFSSGSMNHLNRSTGQPEKPDYISNFQL